jgi:hypothetical protein
MEIGEWTDAQCESTDKIVSELTRGLSGLTKTVSRVTGVVSRLMKKLSGLTKFGSRLTIGVSELT